ncbi:MAG: phosphatidylglycerophosphatase A [Desulfomonile tiedjei]|nr:phosphatidylglycerophosphatase A [Desulfomonile tiedjei]
MTLFAGTEPESDGAATERPKTALSSGKALQDRIYWLLGTSFGLSYLPVAPGTWGALPGVLLFLLIVEGTPPDWHLWLIGLATVLVSWFTVAAGPWAERYWQTKDPRKYVPDEVAGFLVTVLLFRAPDPWLTCIWAFVVTRFFDILKPPPARRLETIPGGWGILLDDVLTSLYAALTLNILAVSFPQFFGGLPFLVTAW